MNTIVETRFKGSFFPFLLLLSGFAGISYELLYARMLGNSIGDQWVVSAAILLTFLLGIGVGSRYAHRFWPHLWLIEAGIGLYAMAFALSGGMIEFWLYSSGEYFGHGLAFTLIQSFLLLAPPAFLIGIGLPLFAGYMGQLSSGLAFARAYGWHSLGAALTVLLVEFWLFRLLGLQATVFTIATLNLLVAAMLKLGYGELRQFAPEQKQYIKLPLNQLTALALLSIASAIYQLWLVKIAELIIGPFRETFAMVLALVLMGIAAGTWLVRRFRLSFSDVVLANLFGLIWLIVGFELLSKGFASFYPQAVENGLALILLKLALLAALGGVPAVTFGATIPALITEQDNVARESGHLLFISSLANALGFLLMVFILHERFSYGGLLVAIAATSAVGLVVFRRGRPMAAMMATLAVVIMVFGYRQLWNEQFLFLGYDNLHSVSALNKAKRETARIDPFKGPRDVFALNRMNEGATFLFINGYRSMDLEMPYEQLVGVMSSTFAPRNDQALVLGVGSGATASTVGLVFDHVDAVEINAVLLDNLDRMRDYNFDLTNAENVDIFHDDGIRFIKANEKQYSLIINTVTTPRYFSSSKLYTLDFLQTIKNRLTPDGVYVTWFDSRIGDRGIDISLKTLDRVFEQCAMSYMNSGYFLLLCSNQPLAMHQAEILVQQEKIQKYLSDKFFMLSELIPYSLLTSDALPLLGDESVKLNTLDYPALEFEMARLRKHGFEGFSNRMMDRLSVSDVSEVLETGTNFDPAMLTIYSEQGLDEGHPLTKLWKELLSEAYPDFKERVKTSRLEFYRNVLAVSGSDEARYQYAQELYKAERFQLALDEFMHIASQNPEFLNVNFFIGMSLEELDRQTDAIAYFEKELALHPTSQKALKATGMAYLDTGQARQALEVIDRALQIKGSSDNYYLRGLALAKMGEKEQARRAFSIALKITPDNEHIKGELAKLNIH